MDIATLRKVRPELAGLDDETVVRAVALDYPDVPASKIAADLGVKLPDPPAPPRTLGSMAKDIGITALKGAIDVPDMAVGLVDMATGGRVGKALEGGVDIPGTEVNLGFRPKQASGFLDEGYSDPQKKAFQAVDQAEGFTGKLGAAITNPSTIAHSVIESLPSMAAGGVIGRGLMAAKVAGPLTAAAIGEGVTMAGQDAEQIRRETKDGLLTPEQSAYSAAIGVLGGGIAMVGGKAAKALGIHDIDTMIAAGNMHPMAQKGIVRRVLEGMFTEGVLEELPQSVMEQVLQNKALGKPLEEGVDQQAVMGLLAGAAMGGGANVMGGHDHAIVKNEEGGSAAVPPIVSPDAGPLERAAADSGATTPGAAVPAQEGGKEALHEAVQAAIEDEKKTRPDPEAVLERMHRLAADEAQSMRQFDTKQPEPVAEGDITKEGEPFKSGAAARKAAGDMKGGVVKVDGGYVFRPLEAPTTVDHAAIEEAAHQAATSPSNDLPEPTQAQKEAGNYQKGHVPWNGLDLSIENPRGSERSGTREDGTTWSHAMSDHYGYIKRTEGADGEQVDAYLGPKPESNRVFVVDQLNQKTGGFDEHKAMLGYDTQEEAVNAYRSNFDKGWKVGPVTPMAVDEFKTWLKDGNLKQPIQAITKEATDAASAKPQETEAPAPEGAATAAEGQRAIAAPAGSAAVQAAGVEPAEKMTLQQRRAQGKAKQAEKSSVVPLRKNLAEDRLSALGYTVEQGFPDEPAWIQHQDGTSYDWNESAKRFEDENGNALPKAAADLAQYVGNAIDGLEKPTALGEAANDRQAVHPADAAPPEKKTNKAKTPEPTEKFHRGYAGAEQELAAKGKDTHEIVREKRGLVVRRKAGAIEQSPDTSASTTQAAPAEQKGKSDESQWPEVSARVTRVEEEFGYDERDLKNDIADLIDEGKAPESLRAAIDTYDEEIAYDRELGGRGDLDTAADNFMAAVKSALETPKPAPKPAKARPKVSANTIVSEDAAAKARALLKSKLSTPMSGIDPELMQAGITLAIYHIERGARTFAAYAKAMVDDLGTGVSAYLKSWYMAAKYDPRSSGFSKEMSSTAFVDEFDVAELAAPSDKGEVETEPKTDDTGHTHHANTAPTEPVSGDRESGAGEDATTGDGNREPVDAGLAGKGEGAAGVKPVPAGARGAGKGGAQRVRKPRQQPSSPARDSRALWDEPGATGSVDPATAPVSDKPAMDFDLAGESIGKGGLSAKYRDNIAAIRILKAMEAESRVATPEERRQIARYVGWGALKGVFDPSNKQWAKEHEELKGLLTAGEWKAAKASILNAHYTSKDVVGSMFDSLSRLGFTTGRVLEPSVGVGNFFGLMPADMRKGSQLWGVELDPLTAKIAAALYPSAKVRNQGFEEFSVPAEFFDLAIGNPPFGSEPLVDMERSPYSNLSIHNYFFAKSIDKLRPGGLLAMVVSHNFMDAQTDTARKWIAERANLIAAVRLPNTAFKENAGTEVVTDIVFLQKKSRSEAANDLDNGVSWLSAGKQVNTDPKTGERHEHRVNEYFLKNTDNVLGTPSAAGTMYRAGEYTVEPSGDLGDQLREWAKTLPEGIFSPIDRTNEMETADATVPEGVKVGSFYVDDKGAVRQRGNDRMGAQTSVEWIAPNAKSEERMRGQIQLRDALRDQMRMERSADTADAAVEDGRKKLNKPCTTPSRRSTAT
jgi:hypothetical protein